MFVAFACTANTPGLTPRALASCPFDLWFSVRKVQKLTEHRSSSVLLDIYRKALDARNRQAVNVLFRKKAHNMATSLDALERRVSLRASGEWRARQDSNLQPSDSKSVTLSN